MLPLGVQWDPRIDPDEPFFALLWDIKLDIVMVPKTVPVELGPVTRTNLSEMADENSC